MNADRKPHFDDHIGHGHSVMDGDVVAFRRAVDDRINDRSGKLYVHCEKGLMPAAGGLDRAY